MRPSEVLRKHGKSFIGMVGTADSVCLIGAWALGNGFTIETLETDIFKVYSDFNRSEYAPVVAKTIREIDPDFANVIVSRSSGTPPDTFLAYQYSDAHTEENVLNVMEKAEVELGWMG